MSERVEWVSYAYRFVVFTIICHTDGSCFAPNAIRMQLKFPAVVHYSLLAIPRINQAGAAEQTRKNTSAARSRTVDIPCEYVLQPRWSSTAVAVCIEAASITVVVGYEELVLNCLRFSPRAILSYADNDPYRRTLEIAQQTLVSV